MTVDPSPSSPSQTRVGARLFAAALLFLASFVFSRMAQEMWPEAVVAVRALVALLPAAAFLVLVREMARSLGQGDELEQRIQIEALSFAFILATALVMALGHLQKGGVLHGGAQENWVVIPICYYYGLFRARRRYHA